MSCDLLDLAHVHVQAGEEVLLLSPSARSPAAGWSNSGAFILEQDRK